MVGQRRRVREHKRPIKVFALAYMEKEFEIKFSLMNFGNCICRCKLEVQLRICGSKRLLPREFKDDSSRSICEKDKGRKASKRQV